MRRVIIAMVAAVLAAGVMASPALASPSHHRFSSADVVAVWHSKTRLSSTRFKVTTWFVDVFSFGTRTVSQVFKEVDKCTVVSGHRRCRVASVSAGFRKSLTPAQFTFDRRHLSAAHLDATFTLHTFIPRKPARTSRVRIVATWSANGKIIRSGGVDNFHMGCLRFHDTFHGRNRPATAIGSVNRMSLGSTKEASISTSTDVSVEHSC